MDKQKLIREAAEIEDPLKRQMTVSAIIATELEKKGTAVVLVGGSAVEFYTAANYLTRDMDFIANHTDHVKETMLGLGFKSHGGTWHLPDSSILVEFPPGPLEGDWDRTQEVTLSNGTSIKVIGIEDIILDRANAATHWQDRSEEWVLNMITSRYEDIDWDYLMKRAKEEQCEEVILSSKEQALEQRALFENEIVKQQRIDEISGAIPSSIGTNNSAHREYITQAKSIIGESGLWLDDTDTKIALKMIQKGYSKWKVKDAILQVSPHVIGMPQNERIQYVKKIVPSLSRGLNR